MVRARAAAREGRARPRDGPGDPPAPITRLHLIALAAILLTAAALRIAVVVATPNFFSPGDPAVYYSMARGCVLHGVPRIDFIWNFLIPSGVVTHVENYYEPAYAYLLALPMLVTGPRVITAEAMSVVAGVMVVFMVFLAGRRISPATALVAAGLVAIEPWSVWYGGLLMKEATVAAVVRVFIGLLLHTTTAPRMSPWKGISLAGATIAAGLFQYEMILILSVTSLVVLWIHRRRLTVPYLVALVAGVGLLLLVTERTLGVPISAKVFYVLGRSLWNPGATTHAFVSAWRFLPILYVSASIAGAWYPALFVLAAIGAITARAPRPMVTIPVTFTLAFLYFHGVAFDLWSRDFVVLTPVVAPLAAAVLTGAVHWRSRSWALAAAMAIVAFAAFAPWSGPSFRRVAWDAGVEVLWPAMMPALAIGAVAFLVGWLLRRRLPLVAFGRWLAPALALAMLVQFICSLSPGTIYGNRIVRDYERLRAERERIGGRLGRLIPGATVMVADPWEITLYSGLKSVLIPLDHRSGSVRTVQAQYGATYLLDLDPLPEPFLREIAAHEVATLEDYHLYAFDAGASRPLPALPASAPIAR